MARFSLERNRDDARQNPNPNPNPNPKRMRFGSTSHRRRSVRRVQSDHESEQRQTSGEEEEEEEEEEEDDVIVTSPLHSPMPIEVGEGAVDWDGHPVLFLSDPEVFDCPICLESLTVPIFQCENGHIACSQCSSKVRNKCPSCALPIGYNRCRAIEKVIESVKVSCQNFKYGCREKSRLCKKNEHENMCAYAPCSCPQRCCPFIGSSEQLSAHFTSNHPDSSRLFVFNHIFQIHIDSNQKYDILRAKAEGQLFILNNIKYQSLGNIISVSCIMPSTSKEQFSYTVMAKKDESVVKFESAVDNVAARAENPDPKRFLMVPRDFIDRCGKLKLAVSILKYPETTPRDDNSCTRDNRG